MARYLRKKDRDTVMSLLLLLALFILYIAVIVGPIVYVVFLGLSLIYTSIVNCIKLRKSKKKYDEARTNFIKSVRDINRIEENNSDIFKTQSGRYDERSYAGKRANMSMDGARERYIFNLDILSTLVKIYRSSLSVRVGIIVMSLVLFAYSCTSFDPYYAPVTASVVSIVALLIVRKPSEQSIGSDGYLYPETLPQVSIVGSLLTSLIWFGMVGYLATIMSDESFKLSPDKKIISSNEVVSNKSEKVSKSVTNIREEVAKTKLAKTNQPQVPSGLKGIVSEDDWSAVVKSIAAAISLSPDKSPVRWEGLKDKGTVTLSGEGLIDGCQQVRVRNSELAEFGYVEACQNGKYK